MLKVEVDRYTWYRGHNKGSRLLREDGDKCCVGFACLADGFPAESIRDIAVITGVDGYATWMDGVAGLVSSAAQDDLMLDPDPDDLYAINDNHLIDDAEREAQLIVFGAKVGIEFSFIN